MQLIQSRSRKCNQGNYLKALSIDNYTRLFLHIYLAANEKQAYIVATQVKQASNAIQV